MAMDPAVLATAIADKLTAHLGANPSTTDVFPKIGQAVAEAVVAFLTAHAEVKPDGTPAMAAGGDAVTGEGRLT